MEKLFNEGMLLSAIIRIESVDRLAMDLISATAIGKNGKGEFLELHITACILAPEVTDKLEKVVCPGAIFRIDNEPFEWHGKTLFLVSPLLRPVDEEILNEEYRQTILSEQASLNEPTSASHINHQSTQIATTIARRREQQRHYFEGHDDISLAHKLRRKPTQDSENIATQRTFIFVPAQSEIPMDECAALLGAIDSNLHRRGCHQRVLCTYGDTSSGFLRDSTISILSGDDSISRDEWFTALSMLTMSGRSPRSLPIKAVAVDYKDTSTTHIKICPRPEDPVIFIAPHRQLSATNKALKEIKRWNDNLSWIFYEDKRTWSLEEDSFHPAMSKVEGETYEDFVKAVQQRIIKDDLACEAFMASRDDFFKTILSEQEQQKFSCDPSNEEVDELIKKCLYEPVSSSCIDGLCVDREDVVGDMMLYQLVDKGIVTIEDFGEHYSASISSDEIMLTNSKGKEIDAFLFTHFREHCYDVVVKDKVILKIEPSISN